MALRVSLNIDGDATGAEKAAGEASTALDALGKKAETAARTIMDGFERAVGAASQFADTSKTLGAANDNAIGTVSTFTDKINDLISKATGAATAISKATGSVATLGKGLLDFVRSSGTGLASVTGAIGLATTAVSLLYGAVNSGAETAEKRLDEHARLVGVIRDAYNNAATAAGNFLAQSKQVTEFQLKMNQIGLQADLQKAGRNSVSGFQFDYQNAGIGAFSNPFSDRKEWEAFETLKPIVDRFNATVGAGTPAVKAFRDELASVGLAALQDNPILAKLTQQLLDQSSAANDTQNKIELNAKGLKILNGTADEAEKKSFGLASATATAANEYERLSRVLLKQAAAQEAEALTVGKSAGEAAKLRVQYLLNEAAMQSGIKVAGDYAAQIDKIASRFGAAAQAAAQAQVASNAAFGLSQLGRTDMEARVADQLRGAFGDNVDAAMNSGLAGAVRFTEQMRELKSVTLEAAQGAFRDFRTELQNGATAWEAFQRAAVNALNRILDKLADKALDSMISKLFGAALGGSSGGSGLLGKLFGFDSGGYTGPGGRQEPAGIVHRGEVVFSQDDVSRHGGVAAVEALRRGRLRGYEDGGVVWAPSALAAGPGSGPGGVAPIGGTQRLQIEIAVSVDDDGKLGVIAREAGRSGGEEAAEIRVRTFSRHELPDRVQEIQQYPRRRG